MKTQTPATHVSAFQRAAVRVTVRGALSASAVLGLSLGIAAIPAPSSASASASTSAPAHAPAPASAVDKHPDFDPDALFLSTTTDTLPGDEAADFEAIVGDQVRRVYYVHNRGLLPLDNVTVFDPGANGAAIHCGPNGTSTIPALLPLAAAACTATFTATPGEHQTTATASGTVFLLNVTLTDEAQTGYTAVFPALSASLSLDTANLPAGRPASAIVTVHNTGSVVFTQVTTTPQPPLSISSCGHAGPAIQNLGPGESADCSGVLVPAAGPHVSSVTITGDWRWDHPITEQGPQGPEDLSVQTVASASYTGVPVSSPTPPPPSPSPSSPAPPPPTPGTPPSSPAVVIPQSSQPTPSPGSSSSSNGSPGSSLGPTPTQGPAPTPNPTRAAAIFQQPVSQFQARRGLSLPLKVLVIIIIPAAAAAVSARRISSSRR